MFLLLVFSFFAGIMTVLSPCVLPVLPAILAAGSSGSGRRVLAIIAGLTLSFIFFTLFLKTLVSFTGISPDFLRMAAIILMAVFGGVLLFPKASDWFALKTGKIASFGSNIQRKFQFGETTLDGFILGLILGLLFTPCAGPILATVIILSATESLTLNAILLMVFYAFGSALSLLVILLASRKAMHFFGPLKKHLESIRKLFGALMILTALLLYFHGEAYLQKWTLKYVPFIQLDTQESVVKELARLKGHKSNIIEMPEFLSGVKWFNSEPLSKESLKGKVVLVDFWTYSCINCIRTFPYLKDWYEKYKDKGFVIVGVHTPEFEFEKKEGNVKEAIARFGLTYPIVLDNDYKIWTAYSNLYWPAHYLYNGEGLLVQQHFGEGAYQETENEIRRLLGLEPIKKEEASRKIRRTTKETYLGYARAEAYTNNILPDQWKTYKAALPLSEDKISLDGEWKVGEEYALSKKGSVLELNFLATQVFLVMESEDFALIKVEIDGKPINDSNKTLDYKEGDLIVKTPRKYDVFRSKDIGRHNLKLIFEEGVKVYAFTFGDD